MEQVRYQGSSIFLKFFKKLLNIGAGTALVAIAFPLILVVSIILFISIHGRMIGVSAKTVRDGSVIDVYRFRTAGLPDAVSRFICFTRMDELPGLFNVILGQVSLRSLLAEPALPAQGMRDGINRAEY
jgi:lipopolysaccharide/colanic/teichoic acid biosynthesis glycosyltransferase